MVWVGRCDSGGTADGRMWYFSEAITMGAVLPGTLDASLSNTSRWYFNSCVKVIQ